MEALLLAVLSCAVGVISYLLNDKFTALNQRLDKTESKFEDDRKVRETFRETINGKVSALMNYSQDASTLIVKIQNNINQEIAEIHREINSYSPNEDIKKIYHDINNLKQAIGLVHSSVKEMKARQEIQASLSEPNIVKFKKG